MTSGDAADDCQTLRRLEESLWRSATRFDRAYMEAILAPDFTEFGRSGRTYDRERCLALPAQEIRAELPLREFQIRILSGDVALVTYVSVVTDQEVEVANRSSIWSRTASGWTLRFHQGTAVVAEAGARNGSTV